MKPKTEKTVAPGTRHFYRVPAEGQTGKLITRYWHACQKCEEAEEDYCKKFGAKYWYNDPNYFAGGVVCVAFDEGVTPDPKEWTPFGVFEGLQYYRPACNAVKEMVEIPSRDFKLYDSWDTTYLRDRIQEQTVVAEDGGTRKRLMIPKVTFRPLEPEQKAKGRPVQASRKLRRAVIAEQKRLKLPVMTVQQLYRILGAELPDGKLSETTPTFFLRSETYYVGCDYPCRAKGMEEITPQQYRMNQSLAEREAARAAAN